MPFESNISYTTLKTILIVIGTLGMMYSTTKFKYHIKRIADDEAFKSVFNHATQILFSLYVTVSVTLFNIRIQGTELTEFLLHLAAYSIIILLEYRFCAGRFCVLLPLYKEVG